MGYYFYVKTKYFEFQHKHIPLIKNDIKNRLLFSFLFFIAFALQFVFVIVMRNTNQHTTVLIAVSSLALIATTCSLIANLYFAVKNIHLLNQIKAHGKAKRELAFTFSTEKQSVLKLYYVITKIVSILLAVLLICSCTYFLLSYIYYETIPYYLPMLLTLTFIGFSTCHHVNNRIELQKIANKFYETF